MKRNPFLTGFLPRAFRVLLAAALFLVAFGMAPARAARAASLTVNSAADTAANDGQCTLREAITNANGDDQSGSTDCAAGSGPDTITFSLPINSTITLSSSLPAISSTLTIDGSTAPGLTVSGGGMAGRRPFTIFSGAVVTITRITIAQAIGMSAIFNQGTLTLNDSVVRDNIVLLGAGLRNMGGTLVVNNTTFYNNQAPDRGGGLYIESGTVTLNNSTIYSNDQIPEILKDPTVNLATWPPNKVPVIFVRSIGGTSTLGKATTNPRKPALVLMTRGAADSTLSHELGHTLGLEHTANPFGLMFPVNLGQTYLSGSEVAKAREGLLIRNGGLR